MHKQFAIALLIACSFAFGINLPSAHGQTPKNANVETLKERIVTVPAGYTFNAYFMTPVSSATAYTGQEITLALGSDLYYREQLIARAGSAITGTVIEVFKAKHGTLNGKLTLRFTHILTPDGTDIPISAIIKTSDNSGVLVGDNDKDLMKNTEVMTVSSKTIQSVTSANSLNGGGFPFMNSVGSGGGLLKSVWDKGTEVDIPVNTQIELILTQPITVNPNSQNNE